MGAVVSLERRLREWIAPQANGCVYYTGHLNTDGYPKTRIDGKLVAVHRLVWERAHGPIPKGMNICHRCDTPRCIALKCLFLGTQAQNVEDMRRKGRERKALGEANANARVTADDVRQIRRMAGTTIAIGILFGITSATVSKIKLRRTWRHVT